MYNGVFLSFMGAATFPNTAPLKGHRPAKYSKFNPISRHDARRVSTVVFFGVSHAYPGHNRKTFDVTI